MTLGFSLTFKGFPPVVHKGKLELIELTVGTRSGNKKVTLVHNLDVFNIDLQEFAHKCQVR
jgi:translation initiation factor 1 (eIF-1/SUI1)